jgi:glutathione peroxidase
MRHAKVVLVTAVLFGCPVENPPPTGTAPDPAAKADPEAKEVPMASKFVPNDVVLDHEVAMLDGSKKSLADYRGKAVLVVNTASECGYTPQYGDLQEVYTKYKDRGLEVVAFPSNDFGGQEPGGSEEIRTFVDREYSVEFPMFDKVHAKGPDISPVYKTLAQESGDGIRGEVKWNFTKFLVDPEGKVVARFEPPVRPNDPQVLAEIERVLPKT